MRVFLDTNVLASATATRGLCADVVREVIVSHVLIVSDFLFEELERVLRTKFRIDEELVVETIAMLRQDAVVAVPGAPPQVQLRDKDDLPILASGLAGAADVLVTGDKELLGLRRVGRMDILSPRQFWERLGRRGEPQ